MGLTIDHLLYALIIAVIAYVFRALHRWRTHVDPKRPDLTMQEAWEQWLEGDARHPDQRFAPSATGDAEVPDHVRADVKRGVLEIERLSLEAGNPRLAIRRAIFANATMALQLEAVAESDEQARQALIKGYQAGMDQLLRDAVASCRLKWIVLREYARWKYDDAVASDWFHQYMHLAKPYIREKVRLARDFVLSTDEGAARFAEIYDTLLNELREKMLKTRPKKRFVKPDLPWGSGRA